MLSLFLNAFSVPFKKAHSSCKDNKLSLIHISEPTRPY